MIALAAVLWLVYLVPSWSKSRQYLATERNAVRLQQTLRILAETAEMPDEVRVEANARSIAEQERILKHRAAERELEAIPSAVRTADRLRRTRAVMAGVLALSLAVAVLGGMQAAYTGAWIILVGGVIASGVSLAVLVRLARAGRHLRLPRPEGVRVAPVFVDHAVGEQHPEAGLDAGLADGESGESDEDLENDGSAGSGWVPVVVPRPLYLDRASHAPLGLPDSAVAVAQGQDDDEFSDEDAADTAAAVAAAPAVASAEREALLRAAAAAEEALRMRLKAEHETVADLLAAPVAAPAVPSRFARMGIVEGDTTSHLDLDAVLARRRAG